jgi:hypothetical protein
VAGAINEFWRINLTELGPDLIESGLVDQRTLAGALATLDDPDHVDVIMAFVCVSCRRLPAKDLTCPVPDRNQEEMRNGRPDFNHFR